MMDVFDVMTRNAFFVNMFIADNLANYADKSERFTNLVVKISRIENSRYALHRLGKLYEVNPSVAIFLYEKLQEANEYGVALTLGFILGGVGHVNPQKLFDTIDSNKNPTTSNKISYACALASIEQTRRPPKRFVDMLISYACSDDKDLRHHAVYALTVWLKNMRKVQRFLISYARQSDENKSNVLRCVSYIKDNEEFCIHLLKACSNTDTPQIIHEIGGALRIIAAKRPIEVLAMVKKWCKKKETHFKSASVWAVGDAGKGSIDEIEKFLLQWIRTERSQKTCLFRLPSIIVEIYEDRASDLIRLLSKIDYTEKKKSQLIVKTIQKFLSDGYEESKETTKRTRQDQKQKSLPERFNESDLIFLESCDQILMAIANHQQLEIFRDPTIEDPVLRTLELADKVEHGKKKVGSFAIKKSLKCFPNIVSFFGQSKLNQLIEQKPSHPLVRLLAHVSVSERHVTRILKRIEREKEPRRRESMLIGAMSQRYPGYVLCDMDASLEMLGKNEQGRTGLRNGMLDEKNFHPTLMELNVYARFKRTYSTRLHPVVGNNILDVEVVIDGTRCLFEIYTPKEDNVCKYVRSAHHKKNKVRGKIHDKLERQLKATSGLNLPVILIIDNSDGAPVDCMDISDSLFGTYKWTLVMDKKSKEIVNEYGSRDKKSAISQESAYGNVISAIMLVTRGMNQSGMKIESGGGIVHNPGATVPISKELLEKITVSLFG